MLFDRPDNRKQRELAYRNQLKDQLSIKHSQINNRNPDDYHPEGQAFSLITNIEKQQEERKKKNSQYYDQLRRQIDEERNNKKQAEAARKRKELEEQNKLKEEQQRLQERYQQEMRKEKDKGRKKAHTTAEPANTEHPKRLVEEPMEKESKARKSEPVNKVKSYSYQTPNEYSQFRLSSPADLPPVNLYPNKVENETFNLMTRNIHKNNYYKELLGQRRRLEQETHQIAQMNRVFNFEKYRKKEENRGIEELRSLYRILDDKNATYIGLDRGQGRPTKQHSPKGHGSKVTRGLSNSQKLNKDEWRKLD